MGKPQSGRAYLPRVQKCAVGRAAGQAQERRALAMIATSTGKVRKRTWGWCPSCEKTIGKKALAHGGKCPACAGKVAKRVAYEYTVLVDGKRKRKQFDSQADALTALDELKEETKRPK